MENKDRIRVHIAGQEFSVVGGEFKEMLAAVKQIAGRRFVSELKVWQLPGTAEDVQHQLDLSGYRLEGGKAIAPASPRQAASPVQPGGDRIRLRVAGHGLAVIGGSFQEMLAAVKSLPGRRFDNEAKVWDIPGEFGVIKGMIEAAGFQLEGGESIPLGPVPPMESPATFGEVGPPPPYQEPDFFGDDDYIPEPPEWWDDEMIPPPSDYSFPDEPIDFDPAQAGPLPVASPDDRSGGDRIRLRLSGLPLLVSGGSFQEMLAVIKKIPGRRFNAEEKVWELPDDIDLQSVQQIVSAAGLWLTSE